MKPFDWHRDPISRDTPITRSYRNTQNVRRLFKAECGERFKFDRSFALRLKNANNETMGGAVKEWLRRHSTQSAPPGAQRAGVISSTRPPAWLLLPAGASSG